MCFVSYVVSRLSLADGAILPVGINMGRGVAWRQKHLEITTDFVCVRPNPAKSPRYLLENETTEFLSFFIESCLQSIAM